MIVVGFDPSVTCTGVALAELSPSPRGLQIERWETWRARWRWDAPDSVEGERRRIRTVLREALTLVPDRVDLVVIEGPALRAKFAGKADERAGLRWMLIDQLLARGPVAVVPPKTRALLATNDGNASKADVRAAVRARFPGAHVPDDNVADAVALVEAGAASLGLPVAWSAKQISAHAKVAWPVDGELRLAGMEN